MESAKTKLYNINQKTHQYNSEICTNNKWKNNIISENKYFLVQRMNYQGSKYKVHPNGLSFSWYTMTLESYCRDQNLKLWHLPSICGKVEKLVREIKREIWKKKWGWRDLNPSVLRTVLMWGGLNFDTKNDIFLEKTPRSGPFKH